MVSCAPRQLFWHCDQAGGLTGGDAIALENFTLNRKQEGFINGSAMTILIGGLVLGGLLIYGSKTGQELPLWPAIAVVVVNLVAAVKLVLDIRTAKKLRQAPQSNATKAASPPR